MKTYSEEFKKAFLAKCRVDGGSELEGAMSILLDPEYRERVLQATGLSFEFGTEGIRVTNVGKKVKS